MIAYSPFGRHEQGRVVRDVMGRIRDLQRTFMQNLHSRIDRIELASDEMTALLQEVDVLSLNFRFTRSNGRLLLYGIPIVECSWNPLRDTSVRLNLHGQAISNNCRVGLAMAVVKGDDSQITWDAEAMAKRPFRPAKEQPVNCVHSWRK